MIEKDFFLYLIPEAEYKEKHGVCMGPYRMPELTITSPYVHSRVDSIHIYHGQPYSRVDFNPRPEWTISPSQGLRIWPLAIVDFLETMMKDGI